MPSRSRVQISSLLQALAACGALAQGPDAQGQEAPKDRPDARDNPILSDRSLDESMLERTTRPDVEGALLPTVAPEISQVVPNQPAAPGEFLFSDGTRGWVGAQTLLPEGTFLVLRPGEIVRLRTGGLAFLPATKAGDAPDPAMPLMACEVYGRLAALMEGTERGLWMSLTGEVFQYQGRNYLLPAAFASDALPAQDSPPAPEGEAADGEPPVGDERVEELIRELEAQREERKGIDTRFPADLADGEGPGGPRIEGRMLLGRRGRMVRSTEGGWVIALDNDADPGAPSPALPDRLRLLPCRLVGAMERQAEARGEGWAFEVSGNLYRHGAEVFLLPRLYVSLPSEEVGALQ